MPSSKRVEALPREENDKEPGGHQLAMRVPIRATGRGVEQRRVIRKHQTARRAPSSHEWGRVTRRVPSNQQSAE